MRSIGAAGVSQWKISSHRCGSLSLSEPNDRSSPDSPLEGAGFKPSVLFVPLGCCYRDATRADNAKRQRVVNRSFGPHMFSISIFNGPRLCPRKMDARGCVYRTHPFAGICSLSG